MGFQAFLASSWSTFGISPDGWAAVSQEEWLGFHLRHSSHHLSFIRIADIFIAAPQSSQQAVRDAVHSRALWNLIVFARRLSILIIATSDPLWLRRALAVAAIEDGRFDFRDLIVSLVIARAAAEHVGIDHIPHFNWCIDSFSPTSHGSFTNARDHSSADILDILRSFGPSELLPKRR